MHAEPFTVQCSICAAIMTGEQGSEIEIIIDHLQDHHTIRRILKELAQTIFQTSPKYVEGPNQTIVREE